MKYLYICLVLTISIAVSSCSKKEGVQPMPHTIKVTATGTASFTALVSVIRTTATTAVTLDTKTVTAGGNYDFGTQLNSGDQVHFELQTMSENRVSYSITDNAKVVAQESNKEISSYSKATADYTVN